MYDKFSLDQQELQKVIIKQIKTHYSIEVEELTLLKIGADTEAKIYKALASDELIFFVKSKYDLKNTLATDIPKLLSERGIKELIAPIHTINNKSALTIENFSLSVFPFINGEDGFTRDLTSEQWVILGKTLRQIHNLQVPFSIRKQIPEEQFSSKWRNKLRSIYFLIESEQFVDELSLNLVEFIKKNRDTIQELIERSESLAKELQTQELEFVFCHSDIHAGNVLIGDDERIYIVDWDSPIIAPRERDLMFIGAGVANVWNNTYEEKLFYKGYGEIKINKRAISYYRYERIVEDIAIYCQCLLFEKHSKDDRQVMNKHFFDMFKKNGVVDIALRTDFLH
ncbi:MAG: spectinomycin phosphotransferase [Waddliaceae bacterium]|nr:spectinomycin phosphotransferase [Waddliaceae bacterium]